jgi:hypothetical protein
MIASCRLGTVLAPQRQKHDRTGWPGLLVMFLSLENPRRLDDGRQVPSAVVVVALLGLYLDHVRVQYGVRSFGSCTAWRGPSTTSCTNNEVRKYIERHEVLRMFWAMRRSCASDSLAECSGTFERDSLSNDSGDWLSSLLQCKFLTLVLTVRSVKNYWRWCERRRRPTPMAASFFNYLLWD